MVRIDYCFILFFSAALIDGNIPPIIANALMFLAGLSLKTIPDAIKGKITKKDLLIRLMYIFGLTTAGWLIWLDQKIEHNIIYYIFIVTIFSELIVYLGYKVGEKWLNNKAKNFDNE